MFILLIRPRERRRLWWWPIIGANRLERLFTLLERLHQWSQKPKPKVTSAQRVALSLALQTLIQNKEGYVSILGSPGCSLWVGTLLWPTDHPRMPHKESRWMAHRHIIVCMPRVTLSIGVGWLKIEPGDGQTVEGASKQVCLEWRAFKRSRLDWPCR